MRPFVSLVAVIGLLKPESPTPADNAIALVGQVCGAVFITIFGAEFLRPSIDSGTLGHYLDSSLGPTILVYALALVYMGVRHIGEAQNIPGIGNQVAHVFKVVFLLLFLPAAIITAILFFVLLRIRH